MGGDPEKHDETAGPLHLEGCSKAQGASANQKRRCKAADIGAAAAWHSLGHFWLLEQTFIGGDAWTGKAHRFGVLVEYTRSGIISLPPGTH